MRILSKIALSLLLASLGSQSGAVEPARLAILTAIKDFAAHADLLTASLSGTPAITLVERQQIDKILREQELSVAQGRDALKIGRLLNAEGILLLDRQTEATNEFLSIRLLAVMPGVVVGEHRFALPLTQPTELAKSYVPYLERLLPKLHVKPDDAIGISVLNLRASLPTASAMTLEQELTGLLRLRLAREPAVFLLERQRLKDLAEEKETIVQAEPFWNSAFTLDGIINRDVVERETVSIHAKLTAPRGESINLEVRGKRDALGAVVNDLVEKLLSALNRPVGPNNWQPEAEAEKFFQEALWAYRWGNNRQVMEAADASWSLGLQTRAVSAHRIVARSRIAFSGYRSSPIENVGVYGFNPPPSSEALAVLTEALEIYREVFDRFSAPTNASDFVWPSLGADLLIVVANVLDPFFNRSEFRTGAETELRRLQENARELSSSLTTQPVLKTTAWNRNLKGLPSVFPLFRPLPFCRVLLDTGCVWIEKPPEVIETFRQLLHTNIYPSARETLLAGATPKIGWSPSDRLNASSTWIRFLREMSSSTNAQIRIDALRLILAHSADADELESTARQLFETAWVDRYQIYRKRLDAPVPIILTNVIKRVANWGNPSPTLFESLATDWSVRFAEAQPDFVYLDWRELIPPLTNKTAKSISFSAPRGQLRPEQARELIAEIEGFQRNKQDRWNFGGRYIDALRKSLPSSTAEQPQVSGPVSTPTQSTDWKFSAPLRISRIWDLGNAELPPDRSFGYRFGYRQQARNMTWHKDRLWLETLTYRKYGDSKPALVALAPLTMSAEIFEAPFENFWGPYDSSRSLITGDERFIAGPGGLWRHNSEKGWQKPSTQMSGHRLLPFRGNIVLSGNDAVLEINPRTEDVHLLASTRRNPPASVLDRIGMPNEDISVWPGDRLCAVLNRTVWIYDTNRSDWQVLLSATNCGETLELQSGGAIYRQSGDCGPRLVGGWRPGSSLLEFFICEPVPRGRSIPQLALTPPRWEIPADMRADQRKVAFDGPNVWIFPVPFARTGFEPEPAIVGADGRMVRPAGRPLFESSSPTILLLDHRFSRALELRLELTGAAAELKEQFKTSLRSWKEVEFLQTPSGLAILICPVGILFWVPKQDLDAAFAEINRRDPQPERIELAALTRFDLDKNGWLDDAERRAMRQDVAWRKEEQQIVDTAIKKAVRQHGTEWDQVFATADRDHNGKLSSFELATAATNYPALFSNRLRGVNGTLLIALRPFDLDQDMALNQQEFRTFLAEPRLIAEVNRSADWVTKFGLKVEQCDLNGDGILDANERLTVNRLLRERPTGKASK